MALTLAYYVFFGFFSSKVRDAAQWWFERLDLLWHTQVLIEKSPQVAIH
jgi:hypothetical protein